MSFFPGDDATVKPIRLAFCITELNPGGAEWALFHIVTRLDRSLWEPKIFCLSDEGLIAKKFQEAEIPVTCLYAKGSSDWRVLKRLASELRAFQPSIVQGFLFHANIASRLVGWWVGVPVRISGHRVAEKEKRWHLWLDRLTKKFATHHLCVSQGVANYLLKNLNLTNEEVTVIPNGVIVDQEMSPQVEVASQFGWPESSKVIIGIGRLHKQKGFDILLKAFEQINDQFDDARLLIVGKGVERNSLENQIKKSGLTDKVSLAGYREDYFDLLANSDLFVLSSRWEGMPNVLLQAMQVGLPGVAFDVEGVNDLIEHGVTGLIVKPLDVNDLRDSISRILQDPQLATTMGEKAQTHVINRFTWEEAARGYSQYYEGVLKLQGK